MKTEISSLRYMCSELTLKNISSYDLTANDLRKIDLCLRNITNYKNTESIQKNILMARKRIVTILNRLKKLQQLQINYNTNQEWEKLK